MKRTLLLLLCALCCTFIAQAQKSYSATYRSYCDWNETTKKFENCSGYDDNSLFEMNSDQTMFIHTTATIKSSYYVKSKEHDATNDVEIYEVTSDVGNKYTYIFDEKNKEIRVVFLRDGKTQLLTFTIKAIF
jgi:hypothetical protein